jgi:hypothetical protein
VFLTGSQQGTIGDLEARSQLPKQPQSLLDSMKLH